MKKLIFFLLGFYICMFTFSKGDIEAKIPSENILSNLVESAIEENDDTRRLEKNFTVMLEAKVNIFIPLEVVSDIDIEATVYGNQVLDIPFEIELNKEPERKNYYKLVFSEKEIDIDSDGKIDTYIFSPEFINTRYINDNYLKVYGENISQEGEYVKKVYITVEAGI